MCCFATACLGVVLFTCVFVAPLVSAVTNITIGYLTTSKADTFVRNMQGRLISGAITYAIKKINEENMVPGYRFKLVWNDTHADTLVSLKSLAEQWKAGAVVFFGPEDSCTVEARLAAAFNLPIISYKCSDYEVSDKKLYPTFARTFPPATQVTKSIISLLLHFKWHRYTLVVGSSHQDQTIANKLSELSKRHNITINKRMKYKEPHIPVITGNPFPGIVDETYIGTRVYVFLGEVNGVVDLMTNLYDRGLLDTGDYIVIYVDHNTFDSKDPLKYFKRTMDIFNDTRNLEASRSLLVVTYSPPSDPTYVEFQRQVNRYNEMPPFDFPDPFKSKKITVFAAYLYDAVMLYADALKEVLRKNGSHSNGTAIINCIRDRSFTSVQGYLSHIDANGDAEGNYTVLARAQYKSYFSEYSMRPVGHFHIEGSSLIPNFRLFDGKEIDWILGHPPRDEPECGYLAERCIPPKHYTVEIVFGVLGGMMFVVIIILLVIYRNWRYEQEIAGLLWKIDINDLKTGHNLHQSVDRAKHGSRMTLCSQQSFDSKLSLNQLFAQTGSYKGQVVALKIYELKNFDVNRKMKKDMKLMRDLRHDKVNAFIGACIDPPCFIIITEYCSKGSLQDILENEDLKLDDMFLASLIKDLLQGMIFLHDSELIYHGNLKSSNCVVSSWWTLQVADFGLLEVRAATYRKEDEHAYYRNLLWSAPELLRKQAPSGTQKGDIYAFAIILHEIFGRAGPYGFCNLSPKEVVELVKAPMTNPFRPDTSPLTCESYAVRCMIECWSEQPEDRPDFKIIWNKLKSMRTGMKRNIFDNMLAMMEKYQENLEELVEERTEQLIEEKKKTDALLHRMLPKSVSEQLKRGEPVIPETFSSVTIYFSDICGFTKLSAESSPMQIVDLLNDLYTSFDSIIEHYDVYKVETIGDAYMVVSGLPVKNGDNHAGEIASMALDLLTAIKKFEIPHRANDTLKLRIGIHSGPCVSGVVGVTMPRYTLFGDTVNTASRMETNGEALMIHLSNDCKKTLDILGGYIVEERGLVNMKGKGDMLTYWLLGENKEIRKLRLAKAGRNNSSRTAPTSGSDSLRRRVLGGSRSRTDNQKSPELSPNDVNSTDGYLWDFLKTPDNNHVCSDGDSPSHHSFRSRLNTFRDSVKKKYASSKERLSNDSKSNSRDHLQISVPDKNSPNPRRSVVNDVDSVSQYDNAPPETECLLCNANTANPSEIISLGAKRRSTTGEFELFVVEKKV
ncbi:receptor-type guanylate cyclase Gyc76C-like [Haliotis cracherodii]|uniref:receptor-type guanylate cyclase Gyc76C-like n=1 Tax=Haliotis cracherodii TaxID=6455 RepID=UPI0039EB27B1